MAGQRSRWTAQLLHSSPNASAIRLTTAHGSIRSDLFIYSWVCPTEAEEAPASEGSRCELFWDICANMGSPPRQAEEEQFHMVCVRKRLAARFITLAETKTLTRLHVCRTNAQTKANPQQIWGTQDPVSGECNIAEIANPAHGGKTGARQRQQTPDMTIVVKSLNMPLGSHF